MALAQAESTPYEREQAAIFRGPTWNFICLGAEIPNSADYKTTRIGDALVIVTRAANGTIRIAF
jgi:anthranilate 1,2-dioxygenase large subunit